MTEDSETSEDRGAQIDLPPLGWFKERRSKLARYITRYRFTLLFLVIFFTFAGIIAYTWWNLGTGGITLKDALELTAISIALPALAGLLHQTRSAAYWSSVRAYHDYFDELPVAEKVERVIELLSACNLRIPTLLKPMSKRELKTVIAYRKDAVGKPLDPARIIVEYLNDFEEFASAIINRVVDEDYAYELEGTRLLVAYFGLRVFIEAQRDAATKASRVTIRGASINLISKTYICLEQLAFDWLRRRVDDDWRLRGDERTRVLRAISG